MSRVVLMPVEYTCDHCNVATGRGEVEVWTSPSAIAGQCNVGVIGPFRLPTGWQTTYNDTTHICSECIGKWVGPLPGMGENLG